MFEGFDDKNGRKKPVSFAKPNVFKATKFKNVVSPKLKTNSSINSRVETLEKEIALLTSYSSDTVYKLDYRTMKYEYISPAIERLLGFTSAEFRRVLFRTLIVETRIVTDGFQKVSSYEEFEDKRKQGDVGKWQADYLIRTKKGGKIWVSDISHPWFDDSGKVIGSVGCLRDITDRVAAEIRKTEDLKEKKSVGKVTEKVIEDMSAIAEILKETDTQPQLSASKSGKKITDEQFSLL